MIQKCKNSNFAVAPDGIVTLPLLFSCLKTKCILPTRLACAICAITLSSSPLLPILMGPWIHSALYRYHPPRKNSVLPFLILVLCPCLQVTECFVNVNVTESVSRPHLVQYVHVDMEPIGVTLATACCPSFSIYPLGVPCCVSMKDASISGMGVVTVRGEWAREVITRKGGSHSDPRDDSAFGEKVPDWH